MPTRRNDPCPCESGKKFKACCLPLGRSLLTRSDSEASIDSHRLFHEFRALRLSQGEPIEMAEVAAAVAAVNAFCFSEGQGDDGKKVHPLRPLYRVSDAVGGILKDNGENEDEFPRLFFPRFPFDIVVGPSGATAADLFLARFGRGLPRRAVEAVEAVLAAEDAVCAVVRSRGTVFVKDLRTERSLPAPAGMIQDTSTFRCRLVEYRGYFVPAAPDGTERSDVPSLLEAQEVSVEVAARFLELAGIAIRSPRKGAVLGAEVFKAMTNSEAFQKNDETPPIP